MSKSTRGLLYQIAKFLGDINAVKKGKVGRRVGGRTAGKITSKGLENFLSKRRFYKEQC